MKISPRVEPIAKGFSLIELMIAVAIVGILATIAYPSYTDYILRSHRAEGQAQLTEIQANMERFFTHNNTYSNKLKDDLKYSADSVSSENGYYSVSVDAASTACPIASCYSLTAVAQGSQLKDTSCRSFTLTATGRKTAKNSGGTSNSDCWE